MRVEMRDAGKLASATLAGISLTETIKSSGAEGGFFRKWSGYQASVNTQQVKFATLNARIGLNLLQEEREYVEKKCVCIIRCSSSAVSVCTSSSGNIYVGEWRIVD